MFHEAQNEVKVITTLIHIMKGTITILLLLLQLTCFAQVSIKAILDAVIIKAKQTSMYSLTVNWDSLQQQVYQQAEHATTIQDLKPAFEILLNGLRDHHGKIINAATYAPIAYFTDYKNMRHLDKRPKEMADWKVVNDTALKFASKLLNGKIGYIKIVGIASNIDIEKESKKIRAAVLKLYKNKIDKWIIDLRYNAGGNMHPMMAGIAPLVGDGIVGKLVNLQDSTLFNWEIKNGNFIYDGYQAVNLPNLPQFKTPPKIAVLTSRWTVSSGEIVATALKGRPNTKFFGEATGGFTTNNSWDIINKEIILTISTGIYCDRNGTAFALNIPVDVEVPFKVVAEPEKDDCIIKAKQWLKEK
jgi:carboxyl-terminal processing protease